MDAKDLAAHREWYREYRDAAHDKGVKTVSVQNQCVTVRGDWIAIHRIRQRMMKVLGVEVMMSEEVAPNTYDLYDPAHRLEGRIF